MGHILVIRSSMGGYVGCFHLLAIVMNASLPTRGHTTLQSPVFNSFGYSSGRGLMDRAGVLFLQGFLGELRAVFHGGCTVFLLVARARASLFPTSSPRVRHA